MSALFRLCFFCVRSPIYFCFVSPCFLILSPLFFFVSRFPFRRLRFFFSLSVSRTRARACASTCAFFSSLIFLAPCALYFFSASLAPSILVCSCLSLLALLFSSGKCVCVCACIQVGACVRMCLTLYTLSPSLRSSLPLPSFPSPFFPHGIHAK